MTRVRGLCLVALFLVLPRTAAADDIDVQTSVSRTALWVGSIATYTVTLTCRAGVAVLPEDLGADKLPLTGLQVASHSVERRMLTDGRVQYVAAYQLKTFEPGAEALGVGDWTVRYLTGAPAAGTGGSAPAQELRVPGAALAWRSALPAALTTLDVRDARAPDAVPARWKAARSAGLALLVVSVTAFGWIMMTRMTAGRRSTTKRRIGKESARDLENALSALRHASVADANERRIAYSTLEAVVRRRASDVAGLPGAALTPSEFEARLPAQAAAAALAPEELGRILTECQRARYQPIERLPSVKEFHATLEAAEQLFAPRLAGGRAARSGQASTP